ncbi:competence-specific global transcription modulator domain protein [Streptococcus pneumoniae 2070109]|nr:competence-specific global transcription modulator domain protein [Streptococcus pneumoniae 2070109]
MIKELYEEVQGTVYKCRNEYYLHFMGIVGLGPRRHALLT